MTATRVYKLEIVYPEGSREPGWEPYAWRVMSRRQRRKLPAQFRWPRERMFLSSSGAYGRASLLRWFGAEVEVLASCPVTWPNPDDESSWWERGSTAAYWRLELDEADDGDVPLPTAEFERLMKAAQH